MGMERATCLSDAKGVIREIGRKVKVPGQGEAVRAAAKARGAGPRIVAGAAALGAPRGRRSGLSA